MKKVLYIIIPVVLIVIIYSILGGSNGEDYKKTVEDIRNERIRFLSSSSQSPFENSGIEYQEPGYFPIDPDFKVRAKLQKISNPQRVVIQNSDGSSDLYIKYAFASFNLKGQPLQLLILKQAGFGSLEKYFTAFADQTSGASTYGGGRYLDLDIGKSENIYIDFNLAYNPYCAYVPDYSCPLPPAENILPISIEAGEKDYKH